MRQTLTLFKRAHWQTKCFVIVFAIYLLALGWTTIQCYARITYDRDFTPPTIIKIPSS